MTNPEHKSLDEPLAECVPLGLVALCFMLLSVFCGISIIIDDCKFGLLCVGDYIGVWMLVRYQIKLPGKRERKREAERKRKHAAERERNEAEWNEAERKEKQRNCPHYNMQPYGAPRVDGAQQVQNFMCSHCGVVITCWRIAERERNEAEWNEKQRNCCHYNWQAHGEPRYDMVYGQVQDYMCSHCGKVITYWLGLINDV